VTLLDLLMVADRMSIKGLKLFDEISARTWAGIEQRLREDGASEEHIADTRAGFDEINAGNRAELHRDIWMKALTDTDFRAFLEKVAAVPA
jgi:hypothetical protein